MKYAANDRDFDSQRSLFGTYPVTSAVDMLTCCPRLGERRAAGAWRAGEAGAERRRVRRGRHARDGGAGQLRPLQGRVSCRAGGTGMGRMALRAGLARTAAAAWWSRPRLRTRPPSSDIAARSSSGLGRGARRRAPHIALRHEESGRGSERARAASSGGGRRQPGSRPKSALVVTPRLSESAIHSASTRKSLKCWLRR
jgi:hypothetical protein